MEKFEIRSVKFNFIMNVILKLSSIVFPLITIPYVTRVLGAAGNGKVAFCSSVISYFSMFAQLGIPTYAIRVCAQKRDNPDELTKTVHEILILNSISAALSYIAFFACLFWVKEFREEQTLLIINSLVIVLNMIGMEWFYQAIEQYRYITIRNLVFKCLSVLLMFLLIHKPQDYVLYGSLSVISAAGSYLFNFVHSRKYLKRGLYHNYELKKHIRPILYFFAISIAVSIYTNMDTVMLGFLNTDEQVGYYNVAIKIKLLLITIITALGPVLLPRISNCLAQEKYEEFYGWIKKSLHFVLLVALPLTSYFFVFAPETIAILGGTGYMPAVVPMKIILFTLIPMGIGNVACMQILAPLGQEKYTMYSTIVGAVINLVLNAILIPKNGAIGAAAATVATEICVAFIQLYFSRHTLKIVVKDIPFLGLMLSNFICLVSIVLASKLLMLTPFLNMMVSFIVSAIIYGGCLLLVKDSLVCGFVNEELKKIATKKNKNGQF